MPKGINFLGHCGWKMVNSLSLEHGLMGSCSNFSRYSWP
jgi:hypothetical protein